MSTAFQNSKHFPGELIVRMMQGAKYVRNDSYTSPYTLPTMSSPSILVLSIIFTSIQYNKNLTTIIKLHSVVHQSIKYIQISSIFKHQSNSQFFV